MDWTNIIVATVGALSTLGGVWIGSWLSEHSAREREAEAEVERAEGVRTLIQFEIEANLRLVNVLWDELKAKLEENSPPMQPTRPELSITISDEIGVALSTHFIQRPKIALTRIALDSQLQALPSALSNRGVVAVMNLYAAIGRITTVYEYLHSLNANQFHRTHVIQIYWQELYGALTDARAYGNPLAPVSPKEAQPTNEVQPQPTINNEDTPQPDVPTDSPNASHPT